MSRKVKKTDDLSQLKDGDLLYLHTRGEITTKQFADARDQSVEELQAALKEVYSKGIPLEDRANTGTANTAGLTPEEYDAQIKSRNSDASSDDDEEEEIEDYSEMTNDELRAELSSRGLSIDGNKAELIGRLEEDDAEESEED